MVRKTDNAGERDPESGPQGHDLKDDSKTDRRKPESVTESDGIAASSERGGKGGFSRRELLKRVGMVGAVSAFPLSVVVPVQAAEPPQEPFETLTAAESDTLEAIVLRLIPSDENGPGAGEARAAHYIDRALTGPLASSRSAYSSGLEALNRYAIASRGAPFTELETSSQDAVLGDMEANRATGFTPDASTFFKLLRTHTIEGTFCDPYYGGNANFVGWDLIAYPGIRTIVTPDEQRMDEGATPNHRSAYDYTMFTKGGA
jgi:gluconate 2-dehydrogenase gamma chain